MRLTNRSGQLDIPIPIAVPDLSTSLSPNTGVTPYTTVNLFAKLTDYEEIEANNVQIFADTVTTQNLEMIPLAELPDAWDQNVVYFTPPQNL